MTNSGERPERAAPGENRAVRGFGPEVRPVRHALAAGVAVTASVTVWLVTQDVPVSVGVLLGTAFGYLVGTLATRDRLLAAMLAAAFLAGMVPLAFSLGGWGLGSDDSPLWWVRGILFDSTFHMSMTITVVVSAVAVATWDIIAQLRDR